jgi:hypothetical protein
MKPPGRDDRGEIDHDDLDADGAFQQFFGKSFEQAEEMFRPNAPYLRGRPSVHAGQGFQFPCARAGQIGRPVRRPAVRLPFMTEGKK